MKKFAIAAALGATMLTGIAHAGQQDGPPPRRPNPITMMDADKDGIVTRAEAVAAADAHFERMDRNKDGKLDKDELRPRHRRALGAGGPGGDTPPPADAKAPGKHGRGMHNHRGMGQRMLARVDADKDGTITREEFRAAALHRFDRMDANHDGRIDAAEQAAMRERMRARVGHDGPPPSRPGDAAND